MRTRKILLHTAFAMYILIMLWLLFGQRIGDSPTAESANLIPLRTISMYMRKLGTSSGRGAVINIFGNILTFVPLGFFIPCTFMKASSFRRCFLACGVVNICIECLQFVTQLGCMDVDDLILNLLGIALGYGIFRILKSIKQEINL